MVRRPPRCGSNPYWTMFVAAQVDVELLDVARQVQPLTGERARAADSKRSHDVGRVTGRETGGEGVPRAVIRDVIELERDVGLRFVEVRDELIEDLERARVVAASQA